MERDVGGSGDNERGGSIRGLDGIDLMMLWDGDQGSDAFKPTYEEDI